MHSGSVEFNYRGLSVREVNLSRTGSTNAWKICFCFLVFLYLDLYTSGLNFFLLLKPHAERNLQSFKWKLTFLGNKLSQITSGAKECSSTCGVQLVSVLPLELQTCRGNKGGCVGSGKDEWKPTNAVRNLPGVSISPFCCLLSPASACPQLGKFKTTGPFWRAVSPLRESFQIPVLVGPDWVMCPVWANRCVRNKENFLNNICFHYCDQKTPLRDPPAARAGGNCKTNSKVDKPRGTLACYHSDSLVQTFHISIQSWYEFLMRILNRFCSWRFSFFFLKVFHQLFTGFPLVNNRLFLQHHTILFGCSNGCEKNLNYIRKKNFFFLLTSLKAKLQRVPGETMKETSNGAWTRPISGARNSTMVSQQEAVTLMPRSSSTAFSHPQAAGSQEELRRLDLVSMWNAGTTNQMLYL